jgi:FO synthase
MTELSQLMADAARLRDQGHGRLISYSRKVFIPLTHLCRDVCHYCTFAERPRAGQPAYLSPAQVLAIARAGQVAGCTEALFTLGDKPELRYQAARDALAALGYQTTIEYLTAMCGLVLRETGLLPHANPGVMTREEIAGLRAVTASGFARRAACITARPTSIRRCGWRRSAWPASSRCRSPPAS